MNAPSKFLFDSDFSAGAVKPEAAITAAAHAAAAAEAESRGYAAGLAAAEAQARAEAERRSAAAFERIAAALNGLAGGLASIEARLEAEAVEVAHSVARKLAPALIASEPMAEIAALASRCFRETLAAPHVVIRVNDAHYETAHERLGQIARTLGFEGRLIVLGEPEVQVGDCRIEWADGGMSRDRVATEQAIAALVERYIAMRRNASEPL